MPLTAVHPHVLRMTRCGRLSRHLSPLVSPIVHTTQFETTGDSTPAMQPRNFAISTSSSPFFSQGRSPRARDHPMGLACPPATAHDSWIPEARGALNLLSPHDGRRPWLLELHWAQRRAPCGTGHSGLGPHREGSAVLWWVDPPSRQVTCDPNGGLFGSGRFAFTGVAAAVPERAVMRNR